jgi:hypothetical protein
MNVGAALNGGHPLMNVEVMQHEPRDSWSLSLDDT